MIKKWSVISNEEIANYYIFTVSERQSQSPRTGKTHNFFTLQAKDWVNIIAVTPDENVVMVRQYRHGIDDITLEFPAGAMDEADPDPAATVQRELPEETGYTSDTVIHLGSAHTNPAFLNNKCHTFLALNATKKSTQNLDATEDISFEEVPLASIPEKIADGEISHSLSIAAFYFYKQHTSK